MKLVVSDLDGTLLNDDSEVSLETIQAIKQLKEKGIEFAIATGRSFNSANKIRKKIGLEIYLICNNGANIYNKDGQLIKNNVMPADLIRKVVRFLTENKIYKNLKKFFNFLLTKYVKDVNIILADKERTLATE